MASNAQNVMKRSIELWKLGYKPKPSWLTATKAVPPVPWPGKVPGPVPRIEFEEDDFRKAFYSRAGKLTNFDRFETSNNGTISDQFIRHHMELVQNKGIDFDEAFQQTFDEYLTNIEKYQDRNQNEMKALGGTEMSSVVDTLTNLTNNNDDDNNNNNM